MKAPPLLLVEWIDSRCPHAGWQWQEKASYGEAPKCRTVGWKVGQTAETLHIAQSIADHDDEGDFQTNGVMSIARRQVVKVIVLKK